MWNDRYSHGGFSLWGRANFDPGTLGALAIGAFTAATDIAVPASIPLGFGASLSTANLVGGALLLGGSIALGRLLAPKQPKPADSTISIKQPTPPRQGCYGRARLAGSYMLYEVNPATFAVSVDVLAVGGGRFCGYRQFYLNDDAPPRFGGRIISTPDGRYPAPLVHVDWRLGLGVEVAYPFAMSLVPTLWTADHRGDGIASIALYCKETSTVDNQPKAYPSGLPNPSVETDGYPVWDPRDGAQDPNDPDSWCAYPVYDPAHTYAAGDRVIFPMDSTSSTPPDGAATDRLAYDGATTYARWNVVSYNGVDYYSRVSGNIGHLPTDTSKWIPFGAPYYSYGAGNIGNRPDQRADKWCSVLANPILQFIDYVTNTDHGMGLGRALLFTPVMANWIARANLCDVLVLDKTGTFGPRYTSNGKYSFDDDPDTVLIGIGATCDMWWTDNGDGSLAVEVGVYSAPTLTFRARKPNGGPGDITGFSINYAVADEQALNEIALTFTDPVSIYKEVPGQPWRNEADISARGRIRSQPLALTWVSRHSQARRLAKRAMARANAPNGTMTLSLLGLQGLGERWVNISYPFLPGMGTDDVPVVVELSNGAIDFMAGTVTFNWTLVDPTTIDAWNPGAEEGSGPALIAPGTPPSLIFSSFSNSQYWMMGLAP